MHERAPQPVALALEHEQPPVVRDTVDRRVGEGRGGLGLRRQPASHLYDDGWASVTGYPTFLASRRFPKPACAGWFSARPVQLDKGYDPWAWPGDSLLPENIPSGCGVQAFLIQPILDMSFIERRCLSVPLWLEKKRRFPCPLP